MPVSALTSAIVSSVITAIMESPSSAPQPPVAGIVRPFPTETKLGELTGGPLNGRVVIDGQSLAAAPGLQIRNEMNLIVMPSTLGSSSLPVRYQLDPTSSVWRIWILSPAEVAAANSK